MPFAWDPAKAEHNLAKHGISFEDAWEFDWLAPSLLTGRGVSTANGARQLSDSGTGVCAL